MPLRLFLLPLLAPAIAALVLFLLLGWRLDALFVSLATLAGSLLTLWAARDALKRQLLSLARQVRTRAEGYPSTGSREDEKDRLEEVANLQGAIDSLHQQLSARNAGLNQESRTLTAVLDGM